MVRATLAATLSSVYGIYNGFELCEAAPYPGKEEYLNSEKYELKAWDYDRPGNIREHIVKLNQIRRTNPALWDFRNVTFTAAYNDNIIAYAKMTREGDNCVFVMVNLDPKNRRNAATRCPSGCSACPTTARSRSRTCSRATPSRSGARGTGSRSIRRNAPASSGV